MSQSNIELNNKMSQIIPKIEYCFGMILVSSIIIFVTLSAVFGGVILSPIYAFIFLINKIRNVFTKPEKNNLKEEPPKKIIIVKKPLIDETWCNISVKNIIDYDESEDVEDEDNMCDNCDNIKEDEDDLLCHSCYHKSCEENGDECWCTKEEEEEEVEEEEEEEESEEEESEEEEVEQEEEEEESNANEIEAEVAEEILSLIPPNEIDTIEEEDNIDSLNNYRLNYRSDHKYLTN
jgi:flagellar biosynthesis GTPase FlhF